MIPLTALPELGVGVIYWPALDGVLSRTDNSVDVLELEPQAFWFQPGPDTHGYMLDEAVFSHLAEAPQTCLAHGVGFPVGGTCPPDPEQVDAFVRSIIRLGAPWASEHLSFNRLRQAGGEIDMGFLLPPIQSPESVACAVDNIRFLKRHLPVPLAVETGVNYLKPLPSEMPDGEYFRCVAEQADCGILLDLHNLWANERNGRQPICEVVNQLPLERVIEMHLAGGQEYGGYWVDAHSGLADPELMDIARQVVPRLPNLKAITFEIMPQFLLAYGITDDALIDQFAQLRKLWQLRGTAVSEAPVPGPRRAGARPGPVLPAPGQWEEALASILLPHQHTAPGFAESLAGDDGAGVIRKLISAARAGKVADALPLTTRLLLLTLGAARVDQVLDDFWACTPSEQMASNEARKFIEWALSGSLGSEVPHLAQVSAFELAANQAIMTGREQLVDFTMDPVELLGALRAGRMSSKLPAGRYSLTVTPPAAPSA